MSSNRLPLPPQSERDRGRLTVVLDLDQCLIDLDVERLEKGRLTEDVLATPSYEGLTLLTQRYPIIDFHYDDLFETNPRSADRLEIVTLRPGLKQFLYALSDEFEPILFTGGLQSFASRVLDEIDPSPHVADNKEATPAALWSLWRHRLYRESTVDLGEYRYVKDLRQLGRPMERVVLIENSPRACVAAPDNCIIVPSFVARSSGARDDRSLEQLLPLLRELKDLDDVRPRLVETQKFREFVSQRGWTLPDASLTPLPPIMHATW